MTSTADFDQTYMANEMIRRYAGESSLSELIVGLLVVIVIVILLLSREDPEVGMAL